MSIDYNFVHNAAVKIEKLLKGLSQQDFNDIELICNSIAHNETNKLNNVKEKNMILSKQDFDEDSGKEWSDLCDLANVPKEPWNIRAFVQIEIVEAKVAKYNHIEDEKL